MDMQRYPNRPPAQSPKPQAPAPASEAAQAYALAREVYDEIANNSAPASRAAALDDRFGKLSISDAEEVLNQVQHVMRREAALNHPPNAVLQEMHDHLMKNINTFARNEVQNLVALGQAKGANVAAATLEKSAASLGPTARRALYQTIEQAHIGAFASDQKGFQEILGELQDAAADGAARDIRGRALSAIQNDRSERARSIELGHAFAELTLPQAESMARINGDHARTAPSDALASIDRQLKSGASQYALAEARQVWNAVKGRAPEDAVRAFAGRRGDLDYANGELLSTTFKDAYKRQKALPAENRVKSFKVLEAIAEFIENGAGKQGGQII